MNVIINDEKVYQNKYEVSYWLYKIKYFMSHIFQVHTNGVHASIQRLITYKNDDERSNIDLIDGVALAFAH